MKIATLEMDQLESNILQRTVVDAGHECTAFFTGLSLIDALHYKSFDLLILEWLLPDMDGRDVIRHIRNSASKNMMVMFHTNQISDADVVRGIRAGANDYVTKPISASELTFRIQALAKISAQPVLGGRTVTRQVPNLLGVGIYRFDMKQGLASIRGLSIDLQPKEFKIAVLLFSHVGQVISREKIMKEIWRRAPIMGSRALDTHMSRVRSKLRLSSDNNVRLVTVYNIGYRLDII